MHNEYKIMIGVIKLLTKGWSEFYHNPVIKHDLPQTHKCMNSVNMCTVWMFIFLIVSWMWVNFCCDKQEKIIG